MAETPKPRTAVPKVALPRMPSRPITPQTEATKAPAQTAQADGKNSSSSAKNLAEHVGARVKITNSLSQVFTGEVYSCDSQLVLASGPTDYHIIQVSKILKYEIISPAGSATKSSGSDSSSKEKEKEKERERLAKLKEERLVKPPGVSTTGHRIFLMLDKTLPVRWHNKSIIVLDNVLIEPPYEVDCCKAPAKHAKQLERVKELVKNELDKMPKDSTLGRRGG